MITVKFVYNHYEVFDHAGRFLFSADSPTEVDEELSAIGL